MPTTPTQKFSSLMKNERGSTLLYITGVILILSALTQAALWNFDVGLSTFRSYDEQKQTFYMSEGVRNIVTVLMETFLEANPNPAGSDVSKFLNNTLPPLVPAPFSVSAVAVNILIATPNATVPSGPFVGMNGPITTLTANFTVSNPSTVFAGNILAPLNLQLSLAYISMFQFMVFYDTTQGFLQTGPDLFVNGRMHANGDLCIGSDSGTEYFLKITAGGRLMNNTDGRCGPGGTSNVQISKDGGFVNFANMTPAYDNGCTNCNGTGLNWQAFSVARWHQQALDAANSVPVLTLPGAGMGLVQAAQAGNWAAVNNSIDLRFIVDPVLATDTPVIQSYKFASNADLRIINGVWYIKDPANPLAWPGLPIWSDHPGRFTENALAVGQDDIRDRWAATRPWPAAPQTPMGYSYYGFDSTNQTLLANVEGGGVVSYGNLYAGGPAPSNWIPGDWVAAGASAFCLLNAAITCPGGCGLLNPWSATPPTCAGAAAPGRDPGYASQILNATRGGYRNGHIYMISPGTATQQQNRSRVLPVNFDVNQFQAALGNSNPGELGSYFASPAAFNGVIYVTSIWPGGIGGFGVGGPAEVPFQGSQPDGAQISPAHTATQQALPQPLCSNNVGLGLPATAYANTAYDTQGPPASPVVRFVVPDCANYAAGGPVQAWPNVIRLINAANLSNVSLPNGLSVVSNLPVYMTGNYNSGSSTASATSAPWVSSLVAGDKVVQLSNAWNDANDGWDVDPSTVDRIAADTTYTTALLTEPTTNLSVLLEDWTGKNLVVNGSMVFGYNEVYALHANYCCGNVSYQPPNRTFNFDPHFGFIANQPPGTPVFPVSAVMQWNNSQ